MKGIITAICLFLTLIPMPGSANDDLARLLTGIQKKYGGLPGLTLSYRREVISKTMTMLGDQIKGDLATGQMSFRPPCSLRLDQKTPKVETVIADGTTIWWDVPDEKRVYKYSAKEFGKELKLLSDIFRGLVRVQERFRVSLLKPNDQGESQVELRPVRPWQSINRMILTVTQDHTIRIIRIHYQLGSVTVFTLSDIRPKENFEKGIFDFVVPKGYKVVEENM